MSDNQNDEMGEDGHEPEEPGSGADASTSSDSYILPRRRGRKRGRKTYLDFGKVFEVFPELDTDVLCKLSELDDIVPSKVRGLVPEASAVQIAAFMRLVEDTIQKRKKEKREAPGFQEYVCPEERKPISPVAIDKGLPADDRQVTPMVEVPSDQNAEFMSRLKKLIHAEGGGNGEDSVKFSDQFQTKILNLLEAAKPKEYNIEHFEQIYNKLLNDPVARSQLENLHAARAYKYGYAQFGSNFWYK